MFSLPEGMGMQEGEAGKEPSFSGSQGSLRGFGDAVAAEPGAAMHEGCRAQAG